MIKGVAPPTYMAALFIAHTRPVPIIGVATDPSLVQRHGLLTSAYEGPTGIVGVMQEACREVGLPAMSLWGAVPHYLAANPNPGAMLALLNQAAEILRLAVDTTELETVAKEFSERVDAAVAASDEFAEYILNLEENNAADATGLDPRRSVELVNEIEDFLRDQ